MSTPREKKPLQASRLEIGVIVKPHGVRGCVKALLHNKYSESLDQCQTVTLVSSEGEKPLRVWNNGKSNNFLILTIEGVTDLNQAERLSGTRIEIDRDALTPLEEDQFYYNDLIGCRVCDGNGREWGMVYGVFESGASDVLIIRDAEEERYIPLVDDWIASLDIEKKIIVITHAEEWSSWPYK